MNVKYAKKLRKAIFGEKSQRVREYTRIGQTPTVIEVGLRGEYQRVKRIAKSVKRGY